MDDATRAAWASGFGAIVAKADRIDAERRARRSRWWNDARKWWDDEPDSARPTEVEAVKNVFHACGNAVPVKRAVDALVDSEYRTAWKGVAWDDFDAVVAEGRAMPRQLELPMMVAG